MTTNNKSLSKTDMIVQDVPSKEISKIIDTFSAKASAIAVLPLPFIDIAGVTFLQVRMVNDLAEKYGVIPGDKAKLILSSLISNLIGMLVSNATEELAAKAKIDKILGETLIKATFTGFVTTITGEVYADHFKNGGTIEDISISSCIDYFKRQLNSDRVSIENFSQVVMSSINENLNV